MADLSHLLVDDIVIYRPTSVSDGAGRFKNLFSKVEACPGRIRASGSTTRDRGGREEAAYSDVLYLASGRNIQRGDKIRRKKDGLEAVVVSIRTLSLPDHIEAEIKRTERGTGTEQLPGD